MTVKQTKLEDNGVEHKDTAKEHGKRPAAPSEDSKEPEEQHEDKKARTEQQEGKKAETEQHEDKKAVTEKHEDIKAKAETNGKATKATPAADPKEPLTEEQPKNVVEEGRIYFFYRPRVGLQEAHSLSDVQRFYIIMAPTSREGAPMRLAAVGKKQLPQTSQRFWACIQGLGQKMEELTEGLGHKENSTQTQGVRRTEAARVAGEGVYTIADEGSECRLMYKLEIPEEPQELQEQLNIGKTGDYSLQVKNPTKKSGPGQGLSDEQKVEYPPELLKEFEGTPGGYAWMTARNPKLLDYMGAEFILIGANPDLGQQDKAVAEHMEKAAQQDLGKYLKGGDEDEKMLAKLRAELHAEKCEVDMAPAVEGKMK